MLGEEIRNLLIFIAIFGGLILAHELGHLMAALRCGVRVREFGLGLPPRLLRITTIGGIAITLNWIPLGGFVLLDGEFDPTRPNGLSSQPPVKRLAVFAAGVASNLIIGYLLLVFAFMTGWPDQTKIVDVLVPSPAHSAGLTSGDTILRVNGSKIFNNTQLRDEIYALRGQDVELVVLRDDITMSITITPRTEWPEGQGPAGFTTSMELTHYPFSLAFLRATEQWALNLYELTILPLSALRHQFQSDAVRLFSPVGLKQLSDQAIENAASWNEYFPLLSFASAISIALGVTNLLPLPALDGGRMLFVFIEMIRRKAINPEREKLFHGVGLVALLGLMFVLVIQDIFNPLF